MKRILLALALVIWSQAALAGNFTQFVSGSTLRDWGYSVERGNAGTANGLDTVAAWRFSGYIMGAVDAWGFLLCIPAETTSTQMEAIVLIYLKAHPEKWNASGAWLVQEALSAAFPCKK